MQKGMDIRSRLDYVFVTEVGTKVKSGTAREWEWDDRDHLPVVVETELVDDGIPWKQPVWNNRGWRPSRECDWWEYRRRSAGAFERLKAEGKLTTAEIQSVLTGVAESIPHTNSLGRRGEGEKEPEDVAEAKHRSLTAPEP